MINNKSVKKVLFGGDWNPEQWDMQVQEKDLKMLPKAGIDIVTVNVFSWASIQKDENTYDFTRLDSIIDGACKAGMKICLATGTATHPAWMARKYPEVLRTDIEGKKRQFGARENSCPNSLIFKKYSVKMAEELAKHYGKNKNILAWHVSNEYSGLCYCSNCQTAWRGWLAKKYKTLENLNKAWNSNFWGHTYYDWQEIQVPMNTNERWGASSTSCQIQTIDYYRFQSQSLLDCYKAEYDVLKKLTPEIPVTTNLMGTYPELNYHEWAPFMDFISYDNYPSPYDSYTRTAFNLEVMRGCKRDIPFCLMEQTPSVTNWQPYNSLKRPGVMRLQSYQALAHGSDTVMFFQMHRSRGCCEKFHGAIIDHYATEETRVFKEASAIGHELQELQDVFLGSIQKSNVAILFDWDCLWGIQFSAGPSVDFDYTQEVYKYYDAFAKENVSIDVISKKDSFDRYKVLVAPAFYMVDEESAKKIEDFVSSGGTFITTCMSGLTDMNDLVVTSGYPGLLRKVCGLWVEETDALLPEKYNTIRLTEDGFKGGYKVNILCDIIHTENAKSLATYSSDFYSGSPAITCNTFGKGKAYYVGTSFSNENTVFLQDLAKYVCKQNKIQSILNVEEGIEVTKRIKEDKTFIFVLNHNESDVLVKIPFSCKELLTNVEYNGNAELNIKAKGLALLEEI